MSTPLSFTLNGEARAIELIGKPSALDLLRDSLGLTSLKGGCAPQGVCGCCVALVNGKPRLTCTLPAKTLQGKEVLTQEGLPAEAAAAFAHAFATCGGSQCGYCTPGIVMSGYALLEANPEPSEAELNAALQAHLCRCTSMGTIRASLREAARLRQVGPPAGPLPLAPLGRLPFVDDLRRPGLLHLALVWAPAAHGLVEAVDLEAAAAMPGVVAALSEGPSGLFLRPGARITRSDAVLALILAESPAEARAAAAAVRVSVTAEPLGDALAGPSLHRELGAVEAAFAEAAVVVEATLSTARADGGALEPEAALAVPTPEGITLWSGAHDPAEAAAALQARFGLGALRWVAAPAGGAFGARSTVFVESYALLAAQHSGRPCRLSLDMAEAARVRPTRAPATLRLRLGADADGRLLALEAAVDLRVGPESPAGLAERLIANLPGAYAIPHQRLAVTAWVGLGPQAGLLRGAGAVEAAFAIEGLIDRLAARLDRDPLELRRQNLALPGAGACLDALLPAVIAARQAGNTVGVALGVEHLAGGAWAQVSLEVEPGPRVALGLPTADSGQGQDALLSLAAEALGLPLGRCHRRVDPTLHRRGEAGGAVILGAAILKAAAALRAAQVDRPLGALVGQRFVGEAALEGLAPRVGAQAVVLSPAGAVVEVLAVHDVGRALSPLSARGQLEGAIHQGLGLALSEELGVEAGLPDARFARLGLLKAKGSPPIRVTLLEDADPASPTGAKGAGSIGLVPTPAAVAAAVRQQEGAFREALPLRGSAASKAAGARAR